MSDLESLKKWVEEMASLIAQSDTPHPKTYAHFLQQPELALRLVELIDGLDEQQVEEERAYYSACVLALEICVSQLQAAFEGDNKLAGRTLNQLMANIAAAIMKGKHTLSFWLPVLNAFYEVHVDLSDTLKNAYLELASQEDFPDSQHEEISHLNSIRDLIEELSDLSTFDIAENFFAQSYAMPPDFFADLLLDLYHIEEGQDIALLLLLHPKQEVRQVVVETLGQLVDSIELSSISLSRLQAIKNWYPAYYHDQFSAWIKKQRKKGVVFHGGQKTPRVQLKASEIDGMGAQGIFIHLKDGRNNRLCGLLLKQEFGVKDAWITPSIPPEDVARYYEEAFDDSVMLRAVDSSYLLMMTNHFLALTIERGEMPDLHLLEMQEELGLRFVPQKLNIPTLIEQLAVSISPFTPQTLAESLKRSKLWTKNKRFTESWYVENAQIDKIVNRFCSYVEGVKVCQFEEAIAAVFTQEMEQHRMQWLFHFLWVAFWLKSKAKKSEKLWQDSFFIAYAIYSGMPLKSIPIMQEICYQSVVNSIETMQERRTYLTQE